MDLLSIALTVAYLILGFGAAKMNMVVDKEREDFALNDILLWPLMLAVYAFTLKKDGE